LLYRQLYLYIYPLTYFIYRQQLLLQLFTEALVLSLFPLLAGPLWITHATGPCSSYSTKDRARAKPSNSKFEGAALPLQLVDIAGLVFGEESFCSSSTVEPYIGPLFIQSLFTFLTSQPKSG
jgi:hypothetical protein